MAVVLALTGFMGSGKSALARRAARLLGWEHVDLDQQVESREGRSIGDMFREGEGVFREAELRALEEILTADSGADVVLSLGGGTLIREEARALLAGRAFVVYIDTPVDVCWTRVAGDPGRPLAQNRAAFAELADSREAQYAAAADVVIEAEERDLDELAAEIAAIGAALGERDE